MTDGLSGSPASGRASGAAQDGRLRVTIRHEADVATARLCACALALREGFPPGRLGALATAVTEVARNILDHATRGEVVLTRVVEGGRRGVLVIALDHGRGIPDVDAALRDGYTTRGGLGLGLPGAKRLMDEFTLQSTVGEGTTVVMKKWVHDPGP